VIDNFELSDRRTGLLMRTDADYARELDRQDELAGFRDEFVIDDPNLIYLDGNSLGRLPKRTVERMRHVVETEWSGRLVRGWNDGWFTLAQRVGAKIAQLIGAEADEVIVADSTSVNLFKLTVAALRARPARRKVVTDDQNFPSDLYVLNGAAELAGPSYELDVVPSRDGLTVSPDDLATAIGGDTALVALTHTAFKSGFVHDMSAITELAHRAGSLMLWDLCHSVGAMPIELNRAGVDLAVGCTYKYLNGGPGSPAFLFVRRELQEQLVSPIWGWFGHRSQFDFGTAYEPGAGVARFQAGTPPILSLAAIEPGVDLVLEAGIDRIRAKSLRQTEYLVELWREFLAPHGVSLNSPSESASRGSHVSLGHPEGLRVARALVHEMQVIPDFRAPDNIRFAVSPLYTTFTEIHEAIQRSNRVLQERLFEKYSTDRPVVT
jgi:kynureninase